MRLRWLLRADGHILVLALVAVVFVLQVCALPRKIPHADGAVVGIAASLLDYGIHANAPEPGSTAKPAPSRSMAPGYPALVAAVAALDPRMAQSLRCLAAGQADCLERNSLRALLVLNTLAGLIALALLAFSPASCRARPRSQALRRFSCSSWAASPTSSAACRPIRSC